MPLNIEPLDRNQRTAFQEREALREKVNEIIETVGPMEIAWDAVPTEGHGAGYAVTSEGIKTAIDQETVTRTDADAALGTRIDSETSERSSADTALGTRIDSEAAARTDADTALGTRITEEQSTRQTADTNIRAQIAGEQIARADADTALGTRIDGKQDVLVSGTNIKTVGGTSLLGAGDIPISGSVQWDAVPTAGHGTGYAVTSEGVKNAVDSEAATRTDADVGLGIRIDGKQDTLVSGTNIKTVNGNSLLGAGDIEVGKVNRIVKLNAYVTQANLSGIYDDQMLTFHGTGTTADNASYKISFTGYRVQDQAASVWTFYGVGYCGSSAITYSIYEVQIGVSTRPVKLLLNETTTEIEVSIPGNIVYEGVSS